MNQMPTIPRPLAGGAIGTPPGQPQMMGINPPSPPMARPPMMGINPPPPPTQHGFQQAGRQGIINAMMQRYGRR